MACINCAGFTFGISINDFTNSFRWNGHSFNPSYQDQNFCGDYLVFDSLSLLNPTTTFDCTGFQVGHEVMMFAYTARLPGGTQEFIENGIYDKDDKLLFGSSFFLDWGHLDPNINYEFYFFVAIGIKPDPEPEISYNGNYRATVSSPSLGGTSWQATVTNLDTDVLTRYSSDVSKVWVQGEHIYYIPFFQTKNCLLHDGTCTFTCCDYAGQIWVEGNDQRLHYIDEFGNKRKTKPGDKHWIETCGFNQPCEKNVGCANAGHLWTSLHWFSKLNFVTCTGQMIRIGPGATYTDLH